MIETFPESNKDKLKYVAYFDKDMKPCDKSVAVKAKLIFTDGTRKFVNLKK